MHPEDRQEVTSAWYSMTHSERDFNDLRYRFQRPDGKVTWVVGSAVPLYDSDGKLEGYLTALCTWTRPDRGREKELEASARSSTSRATCSAPPASTSVLGA